MNKKVTFIIPSLNRPTLDRTVESLLSQTNENWEAIILFDGVSGKTYNDERILTLEIPKTGLIGPANGQSGMVRNEGIKICKTEWIAFLDDDDSIHHKYVEDLFKNYNDKDFVVWRMKYISGIVLPPLFMNDIAFANVGISFCFKNKFDNLFFECNRDGEDFDFLMKLKNSTDNWVIAPEIYYNVRH